MSKEFDIDAAREAFASEFDTSLDPLADLEPNFESVPFDPFELFLERELAADNPSDGTVKAYNTLISQFKEFMDQQGRNPACPNEDHALDFVDWLGSEKENTAATIEIKLMKMARVFRYFTKAPEFNDPDDPDQGFNYNPFDEMLDVVNLAEWEEPDKNTYPLTKDDVREHIQRIRHIRKRAYVVTQFKLGLRVGELRNIKLQDVNLASTEVKHHYPELGTHPRVEDHRNTIYIPSRFERTGNKSKMAALLPLDGEMRRLLRRYLLTRPSHKEGWLFLSKQHTQVNPKEVNRAWATAFHPDYVGNENYRKITSHYGRHFFSSFWKVTDRASRELLQYMRGDVIGGNKDESEMKREAVDEYLHVHHKDVRSLYLDEIYNLYP